MREVSRSGQPLTLSKQSGAAAGPILGAIVAAGAAACALAALRALRPRAWSFRDRVVVISGGSRGLGLALARDLAAEGARLYLLARSPHELERVLPDLAARGGFPTAIVCDVRRLDQVAHAIARVGSAEQRIDVLINNAGIVQSLPFEHATTTDFEDALDTHFWAALWLVRACLPWMRGGRSARIVNIASIGGRIGVPHMAPYCVSKFALVGFSETLRAELLKDGIYVTTVCPHLMRTGSYRNVTVRGRHHREAAWFALVSAMPLLTLPAPRAARIIVEACRQGRAHVTPGWPAQAAEVLSVLAPNLFAALTALAAKMVLPSPSAAPDAGQLRRSLRLDLGWMEQWLPRAAAIDLNQPEPIAQ
jgi:NAD(P)-dependent dehydrogenase (short-subunit alcohol dehydrogenase family)